MSKQKEAVFLKIIEDHQNIVHKVCRLYTDSADEHNDLFQEVMTQLWIGYDRFKKESKLSTWIYRVALYTAITYIKKVMKTREVLKSVEPEQQSYELAYDQDSEEAILWRAIKKLEENDRALVALYIDGQSYKEMSQIIGISESNVGARINRIKSKLKKIVDHGAG